jgi:tripartite-type tricarboxylate transporter receptor subunit TctC
MKRRDVLRGGIAAAAFLAGRAAWSQEAPKGYPERPIELVVVFPPGGGMDVTARILAQEAERILHHSFRVQNRAGGGGLIGHTWLAKNAPADGYTVGVTANPFLDLDFLVRNADFDQTKFSPIVGINFTPVIWVVRTDGPLGKLDFKGVVEKAKAEPGSLKIGVISNSAFEFVTEIVEKGSGAKFVHVPFQGGGPGVTALLGGNIDVTNTFYDEVEQQVRAGQLKVLAVSNDQRYSAIPEVPTMNELGIRMPHDVWGANRFALVPPATPEPIKAYLEASLLKVLRDPSTAEAYKKAGILPNPANRADTQRTFEESVRVIRDFLKESGRLKS